jgi:TDG/mug DNA glycosylase family protein
MPRTLPDLLRPGLDVVFVGINPGERSATLGHYYAHPGNGFWPALAASPLVDEAVTCVDDRRCPERWRIGFTDVVKRVITDSTLVSNSELRAAAPAFRRRIAYASPRAVCFTSTRAFDAVAPGARRTHGWGRQSVAIEGAVGWLMPSTSGRAAGFRTHVHEVLRELAEWLERGAAESARGEHAA